MHAEIVLPGHSLVVLVGASGSGKSTFAARWFSGSEILSSDAFRALVGRGEADLGATRRAFAALHAALATRLAAGLPTVVDATNIGMSDRRTVVRHAHAAGVPAVAIVLEASLDECLAGDAARPGRHVERSVVERQWNALHLQLERPHPFSGDGFASVHRLVGHTAARSAVVRREAAL